MADLHCFVGGKSRDRPLVVAPPDGIVGSVATKDCLRQVGQLLGLPCICANYHCEIHVLFLDLYITVCSGIHETSQADIRKSSNETLIDSESWILSHLYTPKPTQKRTSTTTTTHHRPCL
jgi:hypothetical protein